MERSLELCNDHKYIVSCDISEFYPRLNHHRLDNSLKHIQCAGDQPSKIMAILSNFSGTYSFGLPVGGPAARLLSELVLNQIDRLLRAQGIPFCRFADDYHLFADSYESAFSALVFLSERLHQNQGLHLQKAKTRIMSASEFIATSPLGTEDAVKEPADGETAVDASARAIFRLSIRFDPYSPTAEQDYERIREEIKKVDLIGLLRSELSKSRIHISLSRKIVSAIRFVDPAQRDEAVLSLVENDRLLFPIYYNVMMTASSVYD
jgi:hypothetical protein